MLFRSRPSTTDPVTEILQRVKRLETRFTSYMLQTGYETPTSHPEFVDGNLRLTTPGMSLKECLAAIPDNWSEPVLVYVKDEYMATLRKGRY